MEKTLKEDEYCKSIRISKPKNIKVNNRIFKKVVFSYKSGFSDDEIFSYNSVYVAHEIGNDLYTVEVRGNANLISNSELKQFLTVEIKD